MASDVVPTLGGLSGVELTLTGVLRGAVRTPFTGGRQGRLGVLVAVLVTGVIVLLVSAVHAAGVPTSRFG